MHYRAPTSTSVLFLIGNTSLVDKYDLQKCIKAQPISKMSYNGISFPVILNKHTYTVEYATCMSVKCQLFKIGSANFFHPRISSICTRFVVFAKLLNSYVDIHTLDTLRSFPHPKWISV